MEQIVRIHRVCEGGKAEIIHHRQSACSGDCHKCSGCGAQQETLIIQADNPIGASEGDFVVLATDTGHVLSLAVLVYIVPVVLFFLGYALGAVLGLGGGWFGAAGFALGIGLTVVVDRRMSKAQKTVYTITGYAPGQG